MEIMKYPNAPGYKVSGTSAEAAGSISLKAETLRNYCLIQLREEDMTADECAKRVGAGILAIRPRFSELRRMGWIVDSGHRRKNASGRNAVVWRATNAQWATLHCREEDRKAQLKEEA